MNELRQGDTYSPYRLFVSAQLPISIMSHPHLSDGAKLLFARLALYAGKETVSFATLERLAADLATSTDSIGRRLNELVQNRLIRRIRKGQGHPSECQFIWNSMLASSLRKDASDSADLRKQDSAEVRNQQSGETSQNCGISDDSRLRKCAVQTPQNCSFDSAEMRSPIKEEEIHQEVHKEITTDYSLASNKNRLKASESGGLLFPEPQSQNLENLKDGLTQYVTGSRFLGLPVPQTALIAISNALGGVHCRFIQHLNGTERRYRPGGKAEPQTWGWFVEAAKNFASAQRAGSTKADGTYLVSGRPQYDATGNLLPIKAGIHPISEEPFFSTAEDA